MYKYLNFNKIASEKPFRDRVDIYAVDPKTKKLYGGKYNDGSFGTYGGGIDTGEDPAAAAAREFQEEAGRVLKRPQVVPVPAHEEIWTVDTHAFLNPEKRHRLAQFQGSRTHFIVGELGPKYRGYRGDDTHSPLTEVGLYDPHRAKHMIAELEAEKRRAIHAKREAVLDYLMNKYY